MRMCTGCREMKPKRELVRIVCNKEGVVALDTSGKAAGRGAYICKSKSCLERAVKTRALERAFSRKIEQEIFDKLSETIESSCQAAEGNARE